MLVPCYIVAGCRPWSRQVFDEVISRFPGSWRFAADPSDLTVDKVARSAPRYLFFLHWSWKVPREIVESYECVCFHMTDVPYGRGGTPLQNLIIRGHRSTKLTALRMVDELDAGPVYLKENLSLEGNAEEIYVRASHLAAGMIRRIIDQRPGPVPQEGEPVVFKRRKPIESRIPNLPGPQPLYDFIRMLDAEGYPHAFLDHEGFRYEFRQAALENESVVANVTITRLSGDQP